MKLVRVDYTSAAALIDLYCSLANRGQPGNIEQPQKP